MKNQKTPSDILSIFANDQRMILYRPEWRQITGSVTATILLQQILYRWDKNNREPFYKFRAPCGHDLYRPGDSWTEELGFSRFEFDNALKKIGVKRTKKAPSNPSAMVEYWTDLNRVTYYTINPEALKFQLLKVYPDTEFTKIHKLNLPVNPQTEFTSLLTKNNNTTTETGGCCSSNQNSKSNDTPPGTSPKKAGGSAGLQESKIPNLSTSGNELQELLSLIPGSLHSPMLINLIITALRSHESLFLKECILYALENSNQGIKAFNSFLGLTIKNNWAAGFLQTQKQDLDHQRQRHKNQEQEFLKSRREMPTEILKLDAARGCKVSAQVLKERYNKATLEHINNAETRIK